jgi:DNA-binding MarR family transcriptional regulator
MTQHEIHLHKVEGRVLTYLHRVKYQYENALYTFLGRGVTQQEFTGIVDKLVEKGIITRIHGSKDASILRWVETEQLTEVGHGPNNLNY